MKNPAQDKPGAPQSTSYRPKVMPPPFEGPSPRTPSRPKPATWEEMLGVPPPLPREKGIPETEPTALGTSGASPGKQKPAKPSPEERKKQSRLQAFQRELEEIYRLQKKREEEMRARWQQHEDLKKQREEEAKKAHKPLLEPVTKVKRGILGGTMRMFGLGKKQRQVEIAKTPTN